MMYSVATTDSEGERQSQAAVPMSGVDGERLDLSTRQAAAYLFPKERGLLLLQLLFLQAVIEPLEIEGIGQVDIAIIRLQSIEVFARTYQGWSKDTALRYITILEALQILQRHRHTEYTEIHVPLIPWQPSETVLANLDALLAEDAAREKLQQLASGVKDRFLLLYGSPHSWPTLFDDLDGTLTDIQAILDNRPGRTKCQLLQVRVANLKTRLEAAARQGNFCCDQCLQRGQHPAQKGDFHSGQDTQSIQHPAQKGDFCISPGQVNGGGSAQKGDFHSRRENHKGPRSAQKGDFQAEPQSSNGQEQTQKGDFQEGTDLDVTQKGDFQRQSAVVSTQKGDFQRSEPAASLNDNVITIFNDSLEGDSDSDNDGTEAAQIPEEPYSPSIAAKIGRKLALFLENSPENTGGFVAKCKVCTPTVIQAAVIDVLVHQAFPTVDPADDRGRPRNKAKWFHDFCKKYVVMPGAPIPAYLKKFRTDLYWQDLEAYWQEIATQLDEAGARYQRYMIAGTGTADLVRKFLRGEIEQQALDEALQSNVFSQEKQLQLLTSAPSEANGKPLVAAQSADQAEKTWMDEAEAEILAEEILRDAGPLGVSKAVAKQEHGVYVVLLTWRGSPMIMKTLRQWRTHLEQVRPMFVQMQRKEESNGTTR